MKKNFSQIISCVLMTLFAIVLFVACSNNNNGNPAETPEDTASNPNVTLTILATSDMHSYLMNYDYYTTSETDTLGLTKLATLIKDYQDNNDANDIVLVDNGDLIQGNPLGDYFAKVAPVSQGEPHPIYRALEYLGYDAAGIGNHEFNYGLEYLQQIAQDTTVPIINANVYDADTGANEFQPYTIVTKSCLDEDGNPNEVKVGIISFVPTQILNWDRLNLEGKVTVEDIRACAEKFVPQMKEEGADLIVALAHTGYGSDGEYVEGAENMAYHLTLVDGIDVVIGGHSHENFPAEDFVENTGFQNVDLDKGTINGTFTVQPSKYAEGLGVIRLNLAFNEGDYDIQDGNTSIISATSVANDPGLTELLAPYHEQVINYVSSAVGEIDAPLNSYFALIGDDASVQLVSDAEMAYGTQVLADAEELAEYRDLPLLAAAAPFKAGLSKGEIDVTDYVDIGSGEIAISDVSSLYKYPNTVAILKITGKEVREWLEMSAGIYNTIDTSITDPQPLLRQDFPSYNFDTIDGVTYEIDVTQPARYDSDGNLTNNDAHRIINLQYNDATIDDEQEFLVITNNYRGGGGGNFPIFGEDASPLVYSSSDEVRQLIADYITSQGTLKVYKDDNWRIAPVDAEVYVTFQSSSVASQFLENYPNITVGEELDNGIVTFIYHLSNTK